MKIFQLYSFKQLHKFYSATYKYILNFIAQGNTLLQSIR